MMASDTTPSRYDEAIEALYSPLHQARSPEALKLAAARRLDTIADMHEYMRRIGLAGSSSSSAAKSLHHVIHITGTKGKGSTACMCEAILRERYNLNTGLFTSPHLVDIRERIRINGKPVSKQVFSQAYWYIRQRLEEYKTTTTSELPVLPGFFRIMTLLALHIFSNHEPSLDVVILEVGMGGRYDATNVLDIEGRNVVCGVTLLDLDHTRVLGDVIAQIAWEKGGIFSIGKGEHAISKRPTSNDNVYESSDTPVEGGNEMRRMFFALDTNTDEGIAVLKECARVEGQGQALHLISEGQSLPANLKLGLQGDHQRINAELAVALCQALVSEMNVTHHDGGTPALVRALEHASWPGRCQTVTLATNDETPLLLYLDGAHTPKALEACLKWYSSVSTPYEDGVYRALIFNCSHERNPVELLQQLSSVRPLFDAVYFCRADFERPSMVGKPTARELLELHNVEIESINARTWQETLAQVWTYLETAAKPAMVVPTCNVGEAIHQIQNVLGKQRIEVLATGSLYIVGSALEAVEWKEEEAIGSLSI